MDMSNLQRFSCLGAIAFGMAGISVQANGNAYLVAVCVLFAVVIGYLARLIEDYNKSRRTVSQNASER